MSFERLGTVTSADVQLALYRWPSSGVPGRPVVVLVHGYPDTHAVWEPLAELLADDFQVFAYDVRGAGASSVPGETSAYHLDLLVDDLVAVLDHVAPVEAVHLVAHDWGSLQCWHAVTDDRTEGRIASYTSLSGPCLDHVAHWMRDSVRSLSPRRWGQLVGQLVRSWYIGVFHLPGLAPAAWRMGLARMVPKALSIQEGVKPSGGWPAPTLAEDGRHGIGLYRANFLPRFRQPELRHTEVPVQVLVAQRDPYISPHLFGDLGRWAPDPWCRRVAGGHWLMRTEPAKVARWVRDRIEHASDPPDADARAQRRITVSRPRRRFEEHLVVVTGAGSGIGREAALTFAEHRARLVVSDINQEAADRTATLVRAMGAPAAAYQVDVGDTGGMEKFAGWVHDELGVPDVVINNAGIGMAGGVLDTSVQDWEDILLVNLWGVIHGSRLFGRQMVDRGEGGHIVNIASAAAFTPVRSLAAYATTKAAVLSLSEALRTELASEAVGVTAICPGFVRTNIFRSARFVGTDAEEEGRLQELTATLMGRAAIHPRRVAAAMVKAVEHNRPVVLVGLDARLVHAVDRLVPGLRRRVGQLDLRPR